MATYRIHTARKVITTENRAMFGACYYSGVIESNGHYLPVKYIEVDYGDGDVETIYPKD